VVPTTTTTTTTTTNLFAENIYMFPMEESFTKRPPFSNPVETPNKLQNLSTLWGGGGGE